MNDNKTEANKKKKKMSMAIAVRFIHDNHKFKAGQQVVFTTNANKKQRSGTIQSVAFGRKNGTIFYSIDKEWVPEEQIGAI